MPRLFLPGGFPNQPQGVLPQLKPEFAGATFLYLPSVALLRAGMRPGTVAAGTPVLSHFAGATVSRLQNAHVEFTGTKSLAFLSGMTILAIGAYHSQPGTDIEALVDRGDGGQTGGLTVAITNKWAGAGQHKVYCAYNKPGVGDSAFDSGWINGVKDTATNGNGSYDTVVNKRYVVAVTTSTGPPAHATLDLNVGQSGSIGNDESVELVVIWNRAFNEQQLRRISADPYSIFQAPRRTLFSASTSNVYTLTAGTESFALTGVATGLRSARKATAGAGAYALTGQAAGVRATRKVTASLGAFALTGQAAGLKVSRKLTAGVGAYALTGQASGLSYGRTLAAGLGTFALTGKPASLLYSRRLAAAAGSYSFNGQTGGLLCSRIMPAGTGAYTLSGVAAGLPYSRTLAAGAGSFVLSGQSAAFPISRHLTAGTGVYALAGQSVQFSGQTVLVAQTGNYTLIGQPAGLLYARVMPAGAGVFDLTGIDVGLHASLLLSAQPGSFSLSGQAAAFSIGTGGGTGASAADIWNYVLSNGKTAGQNVVEIRSMLDLLAPGFWNLAIEGTYTAADLLRVIAAVQAGKSTITALGGGAATVEFRAVDDSVTRVTATMDGSERTEVTLNVVD